MKRLVLETAALACAVSMNAQNKAALYDSTQVEALQEIVVKGVRAQKNAVAFLILADPRRGSLERKRTWHRHHLYAHSWCWRLSYKRNHRWCTP